ncbi:MAG TPA: hypothetical protein VM915_03810 [Verrucomicrobiae bacterium]|jgi:hypothetical protein|nr:hypothetical protein [Verrucomicrobiae bacterium]
MTAIPHAAVALTSALGRFDAAASRAVEAATGADDVAMGEALVEMTQAKTQAKAGVAIIRFADEMWDALLSIGKEPQR